jgi:hypothetical protein
VTVSFSPAPGALQAPFSDAMMDVQTCFLSFRGIEEAFVSFSNERIFNLVVIFLFAFFRDYLFDCGESSSILDSLDSSKSVSFSEKRNGGREGIRALEG